MNSTAVFQVMLSAFSAGSACSICGASPGSAFLSSYIIVHRKITVPVFSFLVGKTVVTVILCMLSSALGKCILDANGLAEGVDIYLLGQTAVLVLALFLAGRWIYREMLDRGGCHGKGCCSRQGDSGNSLSGTAALFASGASCGATPCGPLLMVLSQSAAGTLGQAVLSGSVFSITGFLSPVMIWLVISRMLAGKMYREVGRWMKWFQLGCYLLLACITLYTIILYRV